MATMVRSHPFAPIGHQSVTSERHITEMISQGQLYVKFRSSSNVTGQGHTSIIKVIAPALPVKWRYPFVMYIMLYVIVKVTQLN